MTRYFFISRAGCRQYHSALPDAMGGLNPHSTRLTSVIEKFSSRAVSTASRRVRLAIVCVFLMNACAPKIRPADVPHEVDQVQLPSDFPALYYRNAEARGRRVLKIDPKQSVVVIHVGRSGSLARLGHDHVIASHDVRGYVDLDEGRADLVVPLDRLAVDEPHLRAEADLDTQPSAEDIAGTRRNMLGKVLEVQRFPVATMRVTRFSREQMQLNVTTTLHGTARSVDVPVRLDVDAAGMTVSGRFALKQSDFGIVPLSVLGGALQVRDRVDLRFRIRAVDVDTAAW